jgi:Na+/alanine symporter
MTLPNLIGMFLMRKEVKQMTKDYWQRTNASETS